MPENADPIVVTIREGLNLEQALKEKQMEKDIELIERIEKEEVSFGSQTVKKHLRSKDQ